MIRKTIILVLFLFIPCFFGAWAGSFKLTMLEIGTGDANYIKLPNGKDLIIDGGKPNDGPGVFKPFLESLEDFDGVIDYMVATHADLDHYGGLEELLSSYQVNKVYSPRKSTGTYFDEYFAPPVISEGCPWITKGALDSEASGGINPGKFDIGCYLNWDPEVTIRCLSVGNSATTNYNSIVLKMDFGDSSFIFTGDLSGDAVVNAIINNYGSDIPSDIHKVSHHGSISSGCNSAAWINAVHSGNSGCALISCIGSQYHPKPECLDRLIVNQTKIYMTFLDGNITIKADNAGNYSVLRQKIWDGIFDDPSPTTRAAYPPALPSGLLVSTATAQSVILDWDDVTADSQGGAIPAESIKYDVFRSTLDGGDTEGGADLLPGMSEACGIYEKINPQPIPESNYTDSSVSSGSSYYYRVSALRTDYYYERRYSNQASALAGIPSPTPITPTPTAVTPTSSPTATPPPSPTPTSYIPTPKPTSPIPTPTPDPLEGKIGIYRPDNGLWAIRDTTRAYFGAADDTPIYKDFDGDGCKDIAIYRPSSGLWAIKGVTRTYFGAAADIAVPLQFNPSSAYEIGIFRPSSGLWVVKGVTRLYFGRYGDIPVPGDYDGDGAEELGIFRGSSGLWALRGISRIYFGSSADTTVPGDYSGDGIWGAGIFRPSSGLWAIRGVTRVYFGGSADEPVPSNYAGDGSDDIGIFRETSGLWAIRNFSRVYFGTQSDIPVTR